MRNPGLLALTATLALALSPGTARAGKTSGYIQGGAAIPEESELFSEAWRTGFGFSLGVGYRFSPWVEFGGSFALDRFGIEDDRRNETLLPDRDLSGASVDGGDTNILTLLGEMRLYLPVSLARVSPYLTGSAGFFRRSFGDLIITANGGEEIVEASGETALVAGGGAGIGFRFTEELWLTFDGAFLIAFSDPEHTHYVPLRVGIALR